VDLIDDHMWPLFHLEIYDYYDKPVEP